MNLEKTEIWITTEKLLELSDAHAICGSFEIYIYIGIKWNLMEIREMNTYYHKNILGDIL
jgi:hypothetical protein